MSGEMWRVRNKQEAEFFIKYITEHAETGQERIYSIQRGDRTGKQNAALWAALTAVAGELNARGVTLRSVADVIEGRVEVNWNKDAVKSSVWNPIQLAITGKKSSTDLDTTEFSTVVGSFQRCMADNFDINVRFGQESLL